MRQENYLISPLISTECDCASTQGSRGMDVDLRVMSFILKNGDTCGIEFTLNRRLSMKEESWSSGTNS